MRNSGTSPQEINGRLQIQFLSERYWERSLYKNVYRAFYSTYKCISRSGLGRKKHEPDKDGRCIFCDRLVALC